MNGMKTSLHLLVMTSVLVVAASQCLAFVRVEHVSKERAKELGVTIRSTLAHTNEAAVWLEFKAKGELNDFGRAILEIGVIAAGERRVLSATLLPEHPTSDTVIVSFSADPAILPTCVVTVMVRGGPLAKSDAYAFRMRDFIKLEDATAEPTH